MLMERPFSIDAIVSRTSGLGATSRTVLARGRRARRAHACAVYAGSGPLRSHNALTWSDRTWGRTAWEGRRLRPALDSHSECWFQQPATQPSLRYRARSFSADARY